MTLVGELENKFDCMLEMDDILDKIARSRIKSGIAINPDTPISKLKNYIEKIDLVCLMGVHAGFGGQQFIVNTFDRLVEIKFIINIINY